MRIGSLWTERSAVLFLFAEMIQFGFSATFQKPYTGFFSIAVFLFNCILEVSGFAGNHSNTETQYMGVYQLVTLQPGFLHVHLFDRLGIKPEHLLPLEIPCNDAQAIGAGFLKSLQNKGSSVSQPIWKWFTGSVIWSKNTFLKLNSNWAFDFMNEPWIYCLVLCTLDSFLFSDSDIRTKNVTSYRQCSLYFESATVRQTIAIQL